MTTASHFECESCGRRYELGREAPRGCECGGSILVRYDLERARAEWERKSVAEAPPDMWRYAPVLPVKNMRHVVSLAEGWTPLVRARRLGDEFGLTSLWIKDESHNPTGSWEARAYACAVSYARETGAAQVAANAGPEAAVACACYAASAGMRSCVALPYDAPEAFRVSCAAFGADIDEWETGRDPLRIEGLKTAAFDIAEQFDWVLPDVVICPAGDAATALAKGFDEVIELGWVEKRRLQVIEAGGAPLWDAVHAGCELAKREGIFAAPATGASIVELRRRIAAGSIDASSRVVILSTGSGVGYAEVYACRLPRLRMSEADKLGGLITPR